MEIRIQLPLQQLKKLLFGAIAVEVLLALLFALSRLDGMPLTVAELFDFDREVALPTWFSALQLGFISLTLLLWSHFSAERAVVSRRFLLLLGLGFLFLSADEAAMIHERLTPMFKSVDWLPRFRGDRGLWIPLYLGAVFLILGKFRRDFGRLWMAFPSQVRTLFLGGCIFLLGAVGLEVLSYQFQLEQMASHWPYTIQVLFEELFEMIGASIIFYGVLGMAGEALNVAGDSSSVTAADNTPREAGMLPDVLESSSES